DVPGLRIAPIRNRYFVAQAAVVDQGLDLVDHPLGFHQVGWLLDDTDRLTLTLGCPEVLAQPRAVMRNECVGRIENMPMRAIVLLEPYHRSVCVVALELGHIANVGAPKRIDGLIVITNGKHTGASTSQQAQPFVLQRVGVLKLVDQNMAKAALVMLAHRAVTLQQLVCPQQELGKVDHALSLALCLIHAIDLYQASVMRVVRRHYVGTKALFLGSVYEALHITRGIFFVVDAGALDEALDCRQLVGGIEDLKSLRQIRITMMRPQQSIAEPVKSAHPHAPRIQRQ